MPDATLRHTWTNNLPKSFHFAPTFTRVLAARCAVRQTYATFNLRCELV